MTPERETYVCNKAHEIATELWDTEHLSCFGNLEVKMQEIIMDIISDRISAPGVIQEHQMSDAFRKTIESIK